MALSQEEDKLIEAIDRALGRLLDRLEADLSDEPPGDLHTLCHPEDEVGWDSHKHLCSCGTCWKHSERLSGNPQVSSADFKKAHACPTCGSQVTLKHGFELFKD